MEAKNWEHIENLFQEALPLGAVERVAYLDRVCSGDEALRAEVESLLAALEGQDDFMQEPAFNFGMKVLSSKTIESLVGKLIGPYKILNPLGKGGMGEVYVAEDMRLGRKVALKLLSASLVDDNWAKRQLVKEAQAAAMLDHPNICAIHGIEEAEGHSFIVMQYVEGDTLADLIRKQPPGVKQAVSFAVQIVSAVTEAHAHGIIHRDIKPHNIVVTASEQVKVLDFGLAKIVQRRGEVSGLVEDSSRISKNGLVVGTVAYMSPEQLRAERLDFRSDVFSMGTVFYEMISGKKPFERDSHAEIISAILTSRPEPLARTSNGIPSELSRIIFKCLEKDKEQRYQSASEVLYELNSLHKGGEFAPRRRWYLGARIAAAFVLFLLLAAALAFAYLHMTRVQTLAVLPIVNASGDPEVEPLSDGLTEDLINKFSRLSQLRVKAFTAVSGYKGQSINPQEIGRTLGVDAVLTGIITRQGETLVLQTSLINTSDGSQLWGEKYDVRTEQVIDVQEQVAAKVASQLGLLVSEGEKKLMAARQTLKPEALDQYYKGRALWEKRSRDNIGQIMAYFEKAIEIDAAYARPYAGLADCYVLLNTVAYGNMPTDVAMAKARYMALKAVEIDPTLPEAHTSLGIYKLKYVRDWQGAEREFKQAIALNPDYAWAHYWYAQLLVITERTDEAIAQSRMASDFAPFSPVARIGRCRVLYLTRQSDKALACADDVLAEYRDNVSAKYLLSYVYLQKGMEANAIRILEELYAGNVLLAAAPLGFAYGKSGKKAEALKVLSALREASMRERGKGGNVPAHEEAIIYIGLGDNDEAFARLEESYDEGFVSLIYLTVDSIYDNLRSDARFADLARRLNLTPGTPTQGGQ